MVALYLHEYAHQQISKVHEFDCGSFSNNEKKKNNKKRVKSSIKRR